MESFIRNSLSLCATYQLIPVSDQRLRRELTIMVVGVCNPADGWEMAGILVREGCHCLVCLLCRSGRTIVGKKPAKTLAKFGLNVSGCKRWQSIKLFPTPHPLCSTHIAIHLGQVTKMMRGVKIQISAANGRGKDRGLRLLLTNSMDANSEIEASGTNSLANWLRNENRRLF